MAKTHPNADPHETDVEQRTLPGAEGNSVRLAKADLIAALNAIDQLRIHLSFVEARIVGIEQALRRATP